LVDTAAAAAAAAAASMTDDLRPAAGLDDNQNASPTDCMRGHWRAFVRPSVRPTKWILNQCLICQREPLASHTIDGLLSVCIQPACGVRLSGALLAN